HNKEMYSVRCYSIYSSCLCNANSRCTMQTNRSIWTMELYSLKCQRGILSTQQLASGERKLVCLSILENVKYFVIQRTEIFFLRNSLHWSQTALQFSGQQWASNLLNARLLHLKSTLSVT